MLTFTALICCRRLSVILWSQPKRAWLNAWISGRQPGHENGSKWILFGIAAKVWQVTLMQTVNACQATGPDGSEKAWDAGSISTLQSKRSVASAILHVPFLALPQLFSPGAPPQAGFFARSRAAKAGHAEERSRADACSCLILPACSHAPANTCCTSISLTLSHVEEHKQVPALVDRPACARRIPRYLIRVAARQHCRCSGLPSRA